MVIHTSNPSTSPDFFDYIDASLNGDYSGNYYAEVTDNCCGKILKTNVITIEPPMIVDILGPCSRCGDEIVTIDGIVINPINTPCTYKWYELISGMEIELSETGQSLTVNHAGVFIFEVTCGTCVKRATFNLIQCGQTTCSLWRFPKYYFNKRIFKTNTNM